MVQPVSKPAEAWKSTCINTGKAFVQALHTQATVCFWLFLGLGEGVRYRSDQTSPFARLSLVSDPARHFCVPVKGPPGLCHQRLCQLLHSLSPLSDCFSLVTSTDPCALQQLCYHPRMGCCLKLCHDFRSTCALSQ